MNEDMILRVNYSAKGNKPQANARSFTVTPDTTVDELETIFRDLMGRKLEITSVERLTPEAQLEDMMKNWRDAVAAGQTDAGFIDWAAFHSTQDEPAMPVVAPAKLKTVTVQEINAYDLDELIAKHYGPTSFETAAAEEMGSDDETSYTIDKIEPLDKWDAEAIEKFKANLKDVRSWPSVPALLQDMVNNGHLNPGKFLIACS